LDSLIATPPHDVVTGLLKKNHSQSAMYCGEIVSSSSDPTGTPKISQVTKELSGSAKALVDFESAINIWIVDEAFPAHGSTRFL
jgi:hypothetical protein